MFSVCGQKKKKPTSSIASSSFIVLPTIRVVLTSSSRNPVYACMYVWVCMCVRVYIVYVRWCMCVYVCVGACMCVYVCVRACCLCVCVRVLRVYASACARAAYSYACVVDYNYEHAGQIERVCLYIDTRAHTNVDYDDEHLGHRGRVCIR